MPFLSGIGLKLAGAIAGVALFLGALLYVQHLRSSLATAQASVATLTATNQADQAAMAAYQAQVAKDDAAEAALATRLGAVERSRDAQHRAVAASAAQPGQDGPLAPVLSSTLDLLRAGE